MRSLHATKRSPQAYVLFVGIAAMIVVAFSLIFFQSRSLPVSNIPQLLTVNSLPPKPSVVGGVPQQPVAAPTANGSTELAVRQTAAAQSRSVVSKVSYPSMQITPLQRNRLFIIATSIGLIGISLYAMTLIRVAASGVPVTRRPLYNVIEN